MKKIASFIILALAFASSAQAVIVQKIYMKDGSVLSGYIQKQDDNGNLTFHSDIAEICLKSKDVTISNEKNYSVNELDKAWVDWAEENEAFEGAGNNRTLYMADVTSKSKTVSRVKIIERGELVRYLQIALVTAHALSQLLRQYLLPHSSRQCSHALEVLAYQLKAGLDRAELCSADQLRPDNRAGA